MSVGVFCPLETFYREIEGRMATEEIQEQRVQQKLIDIGFKALSSLMIPVLLWAYSLSLDIALLKDHVSDLKEDLQKIEKSIEKNNSSIRDTNVRVQKISILEQAQTDIKEDLDSVEQTLSSVHTALLSLLRR